MGVLAGCDARRRARSMAIPCKRTVTQQRARQRSQNVQVIHFQILSFPVSKHPMNKCRFVAVLQLLAKSFVAEHLR